MIVHLDADAFFASVEQAADVRLRGKPVAVGGSKRGVVASASYEARRLGIYTAMPTAKARKLCPGLVTVSGDFEKYEKFSRLMFSYAYDHTPVVEVASIDEGYFDLKGNCYWSLITKSSGAQVDEFKGCKGKRQRLKLGTGSPYGLAFDADGNLWYTSYLSAANGVYKCSGVNSCARVFSSFINPQYINFAGDFKSIWVSDVGNYQYGAALYQIDLSNGKVLKKITNGLSFFNPPTGIAAGPGPL